MVESWRTENRKEITMKTIGERIAQLRREHGLTQEALGDTIGVSAQTVSKWENNQNAPDISLLPVLAEVLGTSIDGLFDRSDDDRVISYEDFADIAYRGLIDAYISCWRHSEHFGELDKGKLIRELENAPGTNSGVAADSGKTVLLWHDFACVSRMTNEDVLPLLEEDDLTDFFAALSRPNLRKIIRVLCEEGETRYPDHYSFTVASLAKKCGLTAEETEAELQAIRRFHFVQLMEQHVDADESLTVYTQWGLGKARLFLYPILLLAQRHLTHSNTWHCFRG